MKTEARHLRIIYMGTPDFAVAPLNAILDAGFELVAVVTAPDKPAGRGRQMSESPVKRFAIGKHLPVLQPVSLKSPEFLEQLQQLKANLQVVVAFRMLPESVWSLPAYGTLNLHASLLPQYRGAAPINHAIINGETETGVTTFFIEKEIDTGKIILSDKVAIATDDNAGSLHDRLMEAGSGLLVRTLGLIASGNVAAVAQENLVGEHYELKPASKIFKDDCRIHWNRSSIQIHNFVRGLSPYPAAFTMLQAKGQQPKQLKIFKTAYETVSTHLPPGTIITDGKKQFSVTTSDGLLHILEVKLEGKSQMNAEEFMRGFPLAGAVIIE